MWRSLLGSVMLVAVLAAVASADSLYGTVRFKDGSKDRGTTRITQSWNGKHAKLDGKGNYTLDFGGKVGKKITVYVEGKRYTEIEVKGKTRLDIVRD
jgi:hypothetical protein